MYIYIYTFIYIHVHMLYLEFRQRLITSLQMLSNCQMIETFYHGVEDDARVSKKRVGTTQHS